MPVEDALKKYTEGSPRGFHVHVQLLKKHWLVNYVYGYRYQSTCRIFLRPAQDTEIAVKSL
jgi:hypothetical protein